MDIFANLNIKSAVVAKAGKKTGGDKAPLLYASVTKNQFRVNTLLGKTLGLVSKDRILFVVLQGEDGGEPMYVLLKDDNNDPELGSAMLSGSDKEVTEVGKQSLSFNYSGIYTDLFNKAAQELEFDATQRSEVTFKIEAEFNSSEIQDYVDFDLGDVPAVLLTPNAYRLRPVTEKEEAPEMDADPTQEVED